MQNINEYYELLGITKKSSDEEIHNAYKKEARKWHPDLHPGDKQAAEKFKNINKAYKCIKEAREAENDFFVKKILKARTTSSGNNEKIGPSRGSDVYTPIEITFEESILGCYKNTRIHKQDKCECGGDPNCSKCEGTGKIRKTIMLRLKIPKGVYNGQVIKITGKGSVGDEGANNGDLIITVHVRNHDYYTRNNMDILSNINITYPEAVLGTVKVVKTIRGDVECNIPPGIEHGAKLRLKGRGVINEKTGEVGDQIVTVFIDIPKDYTPEQENLLHMLQNTFVHKVNQFNSSSFSENSLEGEI